MCKFVSAQAIHHVFGRQFWLYNRLVLITLAWVEKVKSNYLKYIVSQYLSTPCVLFFLRKGT